MNLPRMACLTLPLFKLRHYINMIQAHIVKLSIRYQSWFDQVVRIIWKQFYSSYCCHHTLQSFVKYPKPGMMSRKLTKDTYSASHIIVT